MFRAMMLAAVFAVAACNDTRDSAENAGEELDTAIEEATGERDLADGPFERAGEEIDEAAAERKAEEPSHAAEP